MCEEKTFCPRQANFAIRIFKELSKKSLIANLMMSLVAGSRDPFKKEKTIYVLHTK